MSKELDALERLYCAGRLDLPYVQSDKHKEDYEIIEKELKALEIIKEKEVVIAILTRSNTLDEYNNNPMFVLKTLVQEEYELLKEVLL